MKIDLNKEPEQLLAFGLIDRNCLDEIMNYQATYGVFLHKYELQAIQCLNEAQLKELFLLTEVNHESSYFRKESELLLRYRYQLQKFRAQDSGLFLGSSLYRFTRLKHQWKNKRLRVSAESDPGEKSLNFISGSLEFNQAKRRLIIGDYQVGLAQGVLLWNSFGGGRSRNVFNYYKKTTARPLSGTNEMFYFRGYHLHQQLGKLQVQHFSSFKQLKGSIEQGEVKITGTGLSGTAKEAEGSKRLREQISALTASYDWKRKQLSAQAIYQGYQDRKLDKQWEQLAYSFSFTQHLNNGRIYTELAHSNGLAMLVGSQLSLAKELDLAICFYRSSAAFESRYENAHRRGWQAESSIYSSINFRPKKHLSFSLFIAKARGNTWENNFTKTKREVEYGLTASLKNSFKQQLYLSYKADWDMHNGQVQEHGYSRMKYQLEWEDLLQHRIRVEAIHFHEQFSSMAYYQGKINLPGSQSLQLRFTKMQLADGSPLFYNYQLALWMAYAGGVYSEDGYQLALKWVKKTKLLRLEVLYAELYYPEREQWSSGDRRFTGPRRSQISAQLIFSF